MQLLDAVSLGLFCVVVALERRDAAAERVLLDAVDRVGEPVEDVRSPPRPFRRDDILAGARLVLGRGLERERVGGGVQGEVADKGLRPRSQFSRERLEAELGHVTVVRAGALALVGEKELEQRLEQRAGLPDRLEVRVDVQVRERDDRPRVE